MSGVLMTSPRHVVAGVCGQVTERSESDLTSANNARKFLLFRHTYEGILIVEMPRFSAWNYQQNMVLLKWMMRTFMPVVVSISS